MSSVSLRGPLAPARFLERPNRFLVLCRLEETGGIVEAHLPDPGRLTELLVPERRVRLRPASGRDRKTEWTAVLVESPGGARWVSVDTTLPNRLVEEALRAGTLEGFPCWELEATEVTVGRSRLDFLLRRETGPEDSPADEHRRLALEVKSVTLVRDGTGLFPDAVTARGARHVRELARLAGRRGWEAAVLFLAQRSDVEKVVAAPEIDPDFATALAEAREAGIRALARRCEVGEEEVRLGDPVPVR